MSDDDKGEVLMLDATIKAKWIEALRSGEYEQGKNHFQLGQQFCCLGVLCRIMGRPTISPGGLGDNWRDVDLVIPSGDQQRTLWKMNDGGTSFAQIADYIEEKM